MRTWLTACCVVMMGAPAGAETVVSNDYAGTLYDVDLATGALSNPRATGIDVLVDVEYQTTAVLACFGLFWAATLCAAELGTMPPRLSGSWMDQSGRW